MRVSNIYSNPASNNSYAGIVDALVQVAAAQGVSLPQEYPPNIKGIIQAILALRELGDAGSGETPPGWKPEYDEDGNIIGGEWLEYPRDGQLWFDTRQGRLFIWENGAWYQCNGADGLTVVGESAPEREVVGAQWYNTTNNNLYIYNGTTWVIVGGDAAVSTATLPLANPTTDTFSNNRPYLPDTSGLFTQEGYNTWLYSALEKLEEEIEAIDPVVPLYMSELPPASPNNGDFWYDTVNLRLLVHYDGSYVPTAIPLTNDDDFNALSTTVAGNFSLHGGLINAIETEINRLKSLPHHTYSITTDKNINIHSPKPVGLYVGNDDNEFTGTEIKGINGASVSTTLNTLTIDTGSLSSAIQVIQNDYLTSTDKLAINNTTDSLQTQIDMIDYVDRISFLSLENTVNQLPTATDVNSRLSTAGGHLHGDISMNGNLITGLPTPETNSGAATKLYVDTLRADAEAAYFKKNGGFLNNLSIRNLDDSSGGIDFSDSTNYGRNAFKFKAAVGQNYSTFGSNDEYWEYAWQFGAEEDFCWRHGNTKVASITKDGITASKLTLGTFMTNTIDGPVVSNKIDVGERLATYKAAFNDIRLALQSSATFDEFKAQAAAALTGI